MTSVNTNASATTALRTLQQTNKALETTQNRISTGLKIGEAKDNAAYWAISTTLKSDNKSLSTVKDALGLGAATVDTAYQGLNKSKEVLDEIKSKLTAATQDGVDRNIIQSEIEELQKQLVSIASSSTFSGENWLSVNSAAAGYNSMKSIVSSFSRDANNAVTIGTIGVDISGSALFDASNVTGASGILDAAKSLKDASGRDLAFGGTSTATGNVSTAGLANANVIGAVSGVANTAANGANATAVSASSTSTMAAYTTTGDVTLMTANSLAATDKLTFQYTVGGATRTVTASLTNYAAAQTSATTAAVGLATDINAALTAAGYSGELVVDGTTTAGKMIFTSQATGTIQNPSTFSLLGVTALTAGGAAKNLESSVGVATHIFAAQTISNTAAKQSTAALTTWTGLAATDKVALDLTIDGVSVKTSVMASNGTGTNSVANLVAALNNDATFSKYATATVDPATANALRITSATAGSTSSVNLNSVGFFDSTGVVKTGVTSNFANIQSAATTTTNSFVNVTLDKDDSIKFDINVNGAGVKTVSIDKALIDKTLGVKTGAITSVANYKLVVDAALTAASVTGVTTVANATNLTFKSSNASGTTASIAVSNLVSSGGGSQISVADLDISSAGLAKAGVTTSDQISKTLAAYISVVNTAITNITSAAADLGSVASRVTLQQSFVDTLMDTIDKGVGNLIDADLSEESTRLQALQTKQSLGVQALSIANASTQNILRLFQ